MTPKDCFGLIVRTVGLLLLLLSLPYFLAALVGIFMREPIVGQSPAYNVAYGLMTLIVGHYCLRGAPRLIEIAYGSAGIGDENTDESD